MNRTHSNQPKTQLPAPKRGLASFGPCAAFDCAESRRDGAIPID